MADSAALRVKRSKLHKAGDHALCRPGCLDRSPSAKPGEPVNLGAPGLAFWRNVTEAYELCPPEMAILERACRCLDRLARIDFIAGNSQPMVKGSRDQWRPNPVYREAVEHEKAFDALVRSLALPMLDETEGKRRNPQQREAAQARWRALHAERDRARGALEA
jgi:hypothetical protein